MDTPFFSVIVASYNAENTIRKTIESVLDQDFGAYEIIVKDACSKDNTVNNIPSDDRIHTYVTKDSGIYDGMNEAIAYARGKYLYFLNCGDLLYDSQVLSKIHDAAKDCDEADNVIYGDYIYAGVYRKQPSVIKLFYLFRTPLNHQSMFFGKRLFDQFGIYNAAYKICADYDFTLRTFRSNVEYKYCKCTICDYLGGGASESEEGLRTRDDDYENLKKLHFTKKERFIFGLKLALTFRRIRMTIASVKSPMWMRVVYQKVVNMISG